MKPNSRDELLKIIEVTIEKEVKDFVDTLREGGVKSFVYVSTSTALMDNFHAFIENGCKFIETCIIETGKRGLRFEI